MREGARSGDTRVAAMIVEMERAGLVRVMGVQFILEIVARARSVGSMLRWPSADTLLVRGYRRLLSVREWARCGICYQHEPGISVGLELEQRISPK